ncbi:hypothetical protein BH20ACT24_BH20ACT24_20660 [soil metagenome]
MGRAIDAPPAIYWTAITLAEEGPPELKVARVSMPEEVAEFEAVSVRGFTREDASVQTGTLHPASIVADALSDT